MKTMKTIKVSGATGPALDWLVAKCEGLEPFTNTPYDGNSYTHGGRCFVQRYSTTPAPAYPIIEREAIMRLTHEQALAELIRVNAIESRIRTIRAVADTGLMGIV